MPALRPVAADARLTLVEHLGELRSRLFACIAMVVVAFAFTYWQNHRVLDIVNEPLTQSQLTNVDCDRSVDPIRSGECFDRALARALGTLRPVVEDLPTRGATEREQVDEALTALDRAVRQAPETADRRPVTLGVAEPFFQTVTVALYAALVITLPLLLYQLYAFLIPAFSRRERQAILPLLLGVPLLFYTGVVFGYFFALPRAVDFLQNFNASQFDILVQAKDYYKFVLMFLAGTGLVFQVPVVVIAISRLGILTAAQMRKQRGMVAVGAAVISALITPTPDVVTMLMVMVPFLVLFEVSVAVAALLERRSAARVGESRWDLDDDPSDPDPGGAPAPAPAPVPRGSGTARGDVGPLDDDDEDDDPSDWDERWDGDPDGPVSPDDADLPPLADDWVEDTVDETVADEPADDEDPLPHGEAPDLRLLGDPEGPRVADVEDPPTFDDEPPEPAVWSPDAPEDDWLARADELDDADPYADDSDDEREL
ncbi:MAG: twin-arginine translocase subunit TatC [Patulibacter sp.]|nr:twin-arginine translocase subunit TatC [Patulibacter sp.]